MNTTDVITKVVKTEEARIVEVIRTVHEAGVGTADDPVRVEVGYWTKDGVLIARMNINDDPMNPLRQ